MIPKPVSKYAYILRFYHRERRRLILTLSDGKCMFCNREKFLSIDHPRGAGWDKRRYNPAQRVRLYWREFYANVPLRVLCTRCNSRLKNNGVRNAQMFLL